MRPTARARRRRPARTTSLLERARSSPTRWPASWVANNANDLAVPSTLLTHVPTDNGRDLGSRHRGPSISQWVPQAPHTTATRPENDDPRTSSRAKRRSPELQHHWQSPQGKLGAQASQSVVSGRLLVATLGCLQKRIQTEGFKSSGGDTPRITPHLHSVPEGKTTAREDRSPPRRSDRTIVRQPRTMNAQRDRRMTPRT